jgi:hypothetical protein
MHALALAGGLAAVGPGVLPLGRTPPSRFALGLKAGPALPTCVSIEQVQKSIETTLAVQALGSIAVILTVASAADGVGPQ